jgi:hypothetical protein
MGARAIASCIVATLFVACAHDPFAARRAIVADARRDLGDSTRVELLEPSFVVAAQGAVADETFDEGIDLLARELRALRRSGLEAPLAHDVAIYLFPSWIPYNEFCAVRWGERCASPDGFYAPSDGLIVVDLGLGEGTLTHELVHPLLETDFPKAPLWLDEGIASLFEAPEFDDAGAMHGRTNWRLVRLENALNDDAQRPFARLDTLFGMSDATFRDEREPLHYAVARFVCQWLDERGALWPFYRRYRDGVLRDRNGEVAFRAAVGVSPSEAQRTWRAWLESLDAP